MAKRKTSVEIKVKETCRKHVVAFGASGKPLGERDDLLELLIAARTAEDKFILGKFDNPPELNTLLAIQAEKLIPTPEAVQEMEQDTDETQVVTD